MVHRVDKKYYFETNKLLDKDMLWSADCRNYPSKGGGYVNAGSETNEQLVVWQRFQDKILIN
jgi:hypothetical protein